MDREKYFTVKELARYAQVDFNTVYRWIWVGKINAEQPEGPRSRYFILKSEAEAYLKKRRRG